MPGPAQRPDEIKALEGEPNKRRYNPDRMKPDAGIPDCPAYLSDVARAEWGRVTPILHGLGVLTHLDMAELAMYCIAYATVKDATDEIKTGELTITTSNGNVIQNPLVGIRNKAAELMHKFACQFGMSPSSRQGISMEPPGEVDEFEQMMRDIESNMKGNPNDKR